MILAALMLFLLADEPAKPDPARGRELFRSCSGCHSTENDDRKMGPSLRTLFGKVTLRNGKRVDTENVRAIVVEGYNGMPSFQYSFRPNEIDDLVAYLQTLRAPVTVKAETLGETLFRAHCSRCHDPAIRSSVGPDLRGKFKPEWVTSVEEGHGGTPPLAAPPLKDWLDEPSRRALFDYLKTY
jgi:mono/diheme cytochrome c family protein